MIISLSAARQDGGVTARVALEELSSDDLLASLEGQQNAIVFHTDLLGEIAIVQRGSGLTQTAYALLSDLVAIAKEVNGRVGSREARLRARRDRSLGSPVRR